MRVKYLNYRSLRVAPLIGILVSLGLFGCSTEKLVEVPVPQTVIVSEIVEVPVEVIIIETVEVPVEVRVEVPVEVPVTVIVPGPTSIPVPTAVPAPGLDQLIVSADMVRGHTGPQGVLCALNSQYQRGEMVVWRMRVTDPATGERLPMSTAELLEMSADGEMTSELAKNFNVTVHLGDGQEGAMRFGPHPGNDPVDYFWTWSWSIPDDYPTGMLDYHITVDWPAQGKSGRWDPLAVGISKLTISERTTGDFIVSADMVRGHINPQGPTCTLTSNYQQGEMVVWRMRATDPETGSMVPADTDEVLANPPDTDTLAGLVEGITAVVHLSDGQEFPMYWAGHPGSDPVDYFWAASWEIPVDYPTGTLDYHITIDQPTEERTGRWDPIEVGISKLTITEAQQ